LRDTARDLAAANIPPGLDEREFKQWVGAALANTSIVAPLMEGEKEVLQLPDVWDQLDLLMPADFPPPNAWRALLEWIEAFPAARIITEPSAAKQIRLGDRV
jgi:hypothetical protein